jgi:hypothetical protein
MNEIWFFKDMLPREEKIILIIWASNDFNKKLNYEVVDLDESYI